MAVVVAAVAVVAAAVVVGGGGDAPASCKLGDGPDPSEPGAPPPGSGQKSRHCSLRLGSCPPACRRYMGSARANRPGRSPKSGKEYCKDLTPSWASMKIQTGSVNKECLRGGVV